MPDRKVLYIRLAVLCALSLSGRFANAQEKAAPNAVQVHVVITDAGAQSDSEVPRLKPEEVKVSKARHSSR